MRTIGLVRHASAVPARDLWVRLLARLQADEAIVLRLPALGFADAAAVMAVIGTLAVVPDAVRLLTAGGLL